MNGRSLVAPAAVALALAGATPALAPAAPAPADPEARASACGSITLGGRGYVFTKRGLPCTRAKRLARYVHRTRRAPDSRWRCSSGSGFRTGGYCERRGAMFAWHPGD